MIDQDSVPYLPNVGSRILRLLNSVKHTSSSFARLYGLKHDVLDAVIQGKQEPTFEIRAAIEKHNPLRLRDLYPEEFRHLFPIHDDTNCGVKITRAGETKITKRKMYRGDHGTKVHYYTYADTAMSNTSLFRPEWISEHYIHDGVLGESVPDWAFNRGHFEHQVTYFIGTVNFHWISDGKKHVRKMNTGDVNYITPFVPHTFTTRTEGEGLILAVTYGGAVASDAYQSKIQAMSKNDFLRTQKSTERLSKAQTTLLTDALGGVMIRRRHEARESEGSSDLVELLSGIPYQAAVRMLEYTFADTGRPKEICANFKAERWGYNIGDGPVTLSVKNWNTTLHPGDSFFIRSGVHHTFAGKGKLLVIEMDSESNDPHKELALINRYSGKRGLERIHTENTQWF